METIADGLRGVGLLARLNWDRLFFVGMLCVALVVGAFFGSLLTQGAGAAPGF